MPTFRRLLIDCTHTLQAGFHTGVQRVVRRVCEESCRGESTLYGECIPVVQRGEGFIPVEFIPEAEDSRGSLVVKRAPSDDVLENVPAWYCESMRVVCSVVPSNKFRRWFLPEPGHLGIFRIHRKWSDRFTIQNDPIIQPEADDLLLLPDAYWAYPDIWPAVDRAKQQGTSTAAVIYDLIPLTHSHFYDVQGVNAFRQYLINVLSRVDVLLTISKTVRSQVLDILPELLGMAAVQQTVLPFRLGAEFLTGDGRPRELLTSIFLDHPIQRPYLMVGTVEIRKNHMFALEAMQRLWRNGSDAKLVIAGRPGWRGDEFLERVQRHPELGRRLFVFHDLSDAEIDFCYRNCQAVVFPSVTEGFGLPIVEALHRGGRVYASDIPIHREVGGPHCEYFSLESVGQLASLLSADCQRQAVDSRSAPGAAACENGFGWTEAVSALHCSLQQAFQSHQSPSLAGGKNLHVNVA